LNPGALHALWTLDGLGAIGADPAVTQAVRTAVRHPPASVRRAALTVLPRDAALADIVLADGGPLEDADAQVRVVALLALSELAPSTRAADRIRRLLLEPVNTRDAWLPDAV